MDGQVSDVTCGVFRRLPPDLLEPDAIHRFVLGEDGRPRRFSDEEAASELGDPFATLVLLAGRFPRTGGEVLAALDELTEPDDPLRTRMFFFLGEGSQIPFTPETASVRRNLRFLVTTGAPTPDGPDVLVSAFHPDEGDVELMAWDRVAGGFNYYRTVGENSAWVFAGNSRHALIEPTEGKGPFESHTSGAFLMKELRAPWINWHSPDAPVQQSLFGRNDPLRTHPWFDQLEELGAVTCEAAAARPSIVRWTNARFDALLAGGAEIGRPERIMRQVLDTPTVNLISSHTEGRTGPSSEAIDLPQTFFVDSEALTEILRLPEPPSFTVSGEHYGAALAQFDFRVTDGGTFDRRGDTHFAFVVPERAFEDQAVVRKAIEEGLLSQRFAACLLMTDFPNPVFSRRRAELLGHVSASARVVDGSSTFSEDMAEAIVAAAGTAGDDSPEAEFAALWATGEGWRDPCSVLLVDYYKAIQQQLRTQEGFADYCLLAESRRERVRDMPIFENSLLFPQTNIPSGVRSMLPNGTVS